MIEPSRNNLVRKVLRILLIVEIVILLAAAIFFFYIPADFRKYYLILVAFLVLNTLFLFYVAKRNFKR